MKSTLSYRQAAYQRYRATHPDKQDPVDYSRSDSKIIPLLNSWLLGRDRSQPCLDLGCGHGSLMHALKTLGFTRRQGVDRSPEQVALAQSIGEVVEQGDIFECLRRQSSNSLGVITLFDVVEHLEKDEILSLWRLVYDKLQTGGVFIVHCPNGDSPFAASVFSSDFTHLTWLNAQSAEQICRLAGFVGFEAKEHLGASVRLAGRVRTGCWRLLRCGLRAWTLVETGAPGSSILTRNFAFKALKPA